MIDLEGNLCLLFFTHSIVMRSGGHQWRFSRETQPSHILISFYLLDVLFMFLAKVIEMWMISGDRLKQIQNDGFYGSRNRRDGESLRGLTNLSRSILLLACSFFEIWILLMGLSLTHLHICLGATN